MEKLTIADDYIGDSDAGRVEFTSDRAELAMKHKDKIKKGVASRTTKLLRTIATLRSCRVRGIKPIKPTTAYQRLTEAEVQRMLDQHEQHEHE